LLLVGFVIEYISKYLPELFRHIGLLDAGNADTYTAFMKAGSLADETVLHSVNLVKTLLMQYDRPIEITVNQRPITALSRMGMLIPKKGNIMTWLATATP
jgi:hypothetical protein